MMSFALYVHFPWCVRKCPYCDFNSHPLAGGTLDGLQEDRYVDALLTDFDAERRELEPFRVDTVFFGGGTPSLFSPRSFERILDHLQPRLGADAEITMEANPGAAEHHDLAGYRSAGINRLSLGVQSFDDEKLEALGRIHDAAGARRSFERARAAGFENVNVDLMFGLPDQSPRDAIRDLELAIALGPEHLSWYQLTLEPKTEFARRPPPLPADHSLEAMEVAGHTLLAESGFERYEVSAWSRADRECRHNLTYWTFGDYLGIGAGAHGKRPGPAGPLRTARPRQPRLYLSDPTAAEVALIAPDALPGEFMLNALRLKDGVPLGHFEAATGLSLDVLEPTRSAQIQSGLLRADRIAATDRGYAVLDSLIAAYL